METSRLSTYDPQQQPDYQIAPPPPPSAQYQVAPAPQYQMAQPGYQPQPYQVAPKSPAVSVLCSVFIPGLGSMVAGNAGIGALILVLYIVGIILSAFLIGIPIAIGMWIWGLVNAHSSAVRWNRQHGIIS
jgi:TM2 domain-containing membrane protein YozV